MTFPASELFVDRYAKEREKKSKHIQKKSIKLYRNIPGLETFGTAKRDRTLLIIVAPHEFSR